MRREARGRQPRPALLTVASIQKASAQAAGQHWLDRHLYRNSMSHTEGWLGHGSVHTVRTGSGWADSCSRCCWNAFSHSTNIQAPVH